MTNGWIDIKNTDMMLIMGGNPAENHPCGFKWPIEAKKTRNAKMIVVDPRFTRTAATADLFLQIRAGADIAFLGGLINYAIENNRIAKDYIINYTTAAFIIKDGFKLPEDGLFSGFDANTQIYDKSTWNYEAGGNMGPQAGGVKAAPGAAFGAGAAAGRAAEKGDQQKMGEQAKNFERKAPKSQPSQAPPQGASKETTGGGQGPLGGGHQAGGLSGRWGRAGRIPRRCSRPTSPTTCRWRTRARCSNC
jgi:anaerobic selenocysteine-containing dehydrogenase